MVNFVPGSEQGSQGDSGHLDDLVGLQRDDRFVAAENFDQLLREVGVASDGRACSLMDTVQAADVVNVAVRYQDGADVGTP